MNDKELINLVALIWIQNGGDALGFQYCYYAILEKIKKIDDGEEE